MGNDGGSIPTRRELVKEAARNPTASEVKESLAEQQEYFWNTDPLTQRQLAQPVVSDHLGRLFNKDSVIEFLLATEDTSSSKKAEQEEFLQGSIKSLKDVVQINFEVDDSANGMSKGAKTATPNAITRPERWVCPVTMQELGPGAKAVYIVPCGHAFSGVAMKEIVDEHCPQCNNTYAPNDLIPILPTTENDMARLALRAKTLKESGLTHSLKKASGLGKKRKKNGGETSEQAPTLANGASSMTSNAISSTKANTEETRTSNGIKNASTASLTAKVLQEQEERNKRRKMDKNENLESLFSRANGVDESRKTRTTDFMNRGYTIPSAK